VSGLALACALAIVDQLDGGVALIELPDGALVTVPRRSLPRRTGEGARVCVAPDSRRGTAPYTFTRARRAHLGEQHD
jgi:hypothetical protein